MTTQEILQSAIDNSREATYSISKELNDYTDEATYLLALPKLIWAHNELDRDIYELEAYLNRRP